MARFFLTLVLIAGLVALGWFLLQWGIKNDIAPWLGGEVPTVPNTFSYQNASADDIFVTSQKPGSHISSNATVQGFARGEWFSDGRFSVDVMTPAGTSLGSGIATARGDWTTHSFTQFTATFGISPAYTGPAVITLHKGGSPSDASLSFPVSVQ
jgi:hypothetical protein